MVPSINPTLNSGSYLWTYPGCPLRILLTLACIRRLQAEIRAAASKDYEVGGALIGRSKSAVTNVVDFVPFPVKGSPTNPRFSPSAEWLAEVVKTCPPDCKVVGYYRTDLKQLIQLGADDLELIRRHFQEPSQVFLVIAPGDATTTAGFFFLRDGALSMNNALPFPLSAAELVSGGWPIQPEKPTLAAFSRLAGRITDPVLVGLPRLAGRIIDPVLAGLSKLSRRITPPVMWARRQAKAFALVLLLALLTFSGLFVWRANSARPPASNLALKVTRQSQNFVLTWDHSAPAIATAKGASLEIFEGSKPPSLLSLTPDQLRSGSLTYGSLPFTEKTEFRLSIVKSPGAAIEESRATISPSAASEGDPPAPPSDPPTPPIGVEVYVRAKDGGFERVPAGADSTPGADLSQRELRASTAGDPAPRRTPAGAFVAPQSVPAPQVVADTTRLRAPAGTFVPPPAAPPPGVVPDTILVEPPPVGRLVVPWTTVPLMLARSVPPNNSIPPSREKSVYENPFVAKTRVSSSAGLLTITSEPSGAAVEINDVFAGSTPVALQISPIGLGFTVTVNKGGFMKWTVQSVAMEQPYALHARLRPR